MDAAWLKETVGPTLVKALAETVAAEPADPVDYLANVLLKSLTAQKSIDDYYVGKDIELEQLEIEKVIGIEKAAETKTKEHKREVALEELKAYFGSPLELFRQAAEYVHMHTAAGGVYVGLLQHPTEKEGSGDPPRDPADGEEPEAEEPPPEEEEPEEEEVEEELEEGEEPPKFNYKKQTLLYAAATGSAGSLRFKVLPPKGGKGITYQKLINARHPPDVLYLPNVLMDPNVHFFQGIPAVGSYLAAPYRTASGELQGVLCVDTLRDVASGYFGKGADGKVLSDEDRLFSVEVAKLISDALEKASAELSTQREERRKKFGKVPPPAAKKDGDGEDGEEEEEEAPAEPEPEPEPEAAAEPAVGEDGEPIEGEAPPPPPGPPPKNPVEILIEGRQAAYARLKASVEKLKEIEPLAVKELHLITKMPQGTFRIYKAVQRVLFGPAVVKYQGSWPQTADRLDFKALFAYFEEAIEGLDGVDSVPKLPADNKKAINAALQGLNREPLLDESWFALPALEWVESLFALDAACLALKVGRVDYARFLEEKRIADEAAAKEAAEEAARQAAEAEEAARLAAEAEAAAAAEAGEGGEGGDAAAADGE